VDVVDHASEREQLHRDLSIKQALLTDGATPLYIEGVTCCCDCVEPLSQSRLVANPKAARCVPCQQSVEMDAKHKAKGRID